jgi:hypothetical protein
VWPLLWTAYNALGNAASIGLAGYTLNKAARRNEVDKELMYVGLGVAAILGLAFIENRKQAAAVATTNAQVVATALPGSPIAQAMAATSPASTTGSVSITGSM